MPSTNTGWLNFTTFDTYWLGAGWNAPLYAEESDDSKAYATPTSGQTTNYLRCRAIDFTEELPSDATIDGIEVGIERRCNQALAMRDNHLRIWYDGSLTGDDKADTGTKWPVSDTYATYGGASDTWGVSPTRAMVTDSDFGVGFAAYNTDSSQRYAYVDHVRIKIYYTYMESIEPAGIGSGEAFGQPSLTNLLQIVEDPSGIPSEEAFGGLAVYRPGDIQPTSIDSGEAFGQPSFTVQYFPPSYDILRVNSIRIQISMIEKSDSGSIACTLVSRTNELLYSEQLNQTGNWTQSNLTVSADATTDPDGTGYADKLVEASDSGQIHALIQSCATLTTDVDVTYSVHLKAAERTKAKLRVVDKAGSSYYATCDLDVDDPAISTEDSCTVRVENYGSGWARYIMAVDIGSGGTTPTFAIVIANDAGEHTYNGDGSSGIYAWGAQAEEASDTVDYILTTTSAQQATVSTRVEFNETFIDVFSITLSVQSEDFATAIYIFRDVPYPWGFKARVFNQSGTRIARTVSWAAKGV